MSVQVRVEPAGGVGGAPPARLAVATVPHFPPQRNPMHTYPPPEHTDARFGGLPPGRFAGLSRVGRSGRRDGAIAADLVQHAPEARRLAAERPFRRRVCMRPVGAQLCRRAVPSRRVARPRSAPPGPSAPRCSRRRRRRRMRDERPQRRSRRDRPRTRARVPGGDRRRRRATCARTPSPRAASCSAPATPRPGCASCCATTARVTSSRGWATASRRSRSPRRATSAMARSSPTTSDAGRRARLRRGPGHEDGAPPRRRAAPRPPEATRTRWWRTSVVAGAPAAVRAAIDAAEGDSLAESENFKKAFDRVGRRGRRRPRLPRAAQARSTAAACRPRARACSAPSRRAPWRERYRRPSRRGSTRTATRLRADVASVGGADPGKPADPDVLANVTGKAWLAAGIGEVGPRIEQQLESLGASEAMLGLLSAQAGLDINKDLLAWMGEGAVFVTGEDAGSLGGALVVRSKDPAATRAAIPKLSGAHRPVRERGHDDAAAHLGRRRGLHAEAARRAAGGARGGGGRPVRHRARRRRAARGDLPQLEARRRRRASARPPRRSATT